LLRCDYFVAKQLLAEVGQRKPAALSDAFLNKPD
jgi:hypothetical protein